MSQKLRYPFLDLKAVNAPYEKELRQAVDRVLASGRYIGGDEVSLFEEELADVTGTLCCVAVSNGLDALRLILRGYMELGRLRPGDQVLVPANTYVASVLAISDASLEPVLVDADPVTMNISDDALRRASTERTKAVLNVHLYGRVSDISSTWFKGETGYGMLQIEDNAQAIGAMDYRCRRTGSLGHAAAFSFYPTKNIGALGDAGAVTTNDRDLAQAVRALANYGSDTRYHNIYRGFNCRMDPLQAAFLRVKLPHLDEENGRRRLVAEAYGGALDHLLVSPPRQPACYYSHVWHQYVVRTPLRDSLTKHLQAQGVGHDIHYATPPHLQPCYRGLPHGPLPVTEEIARECLSLPMAYPMTEAMAREIAAIVNAWQP